MSDQKEYTRICAALAVIGLEPGRDTARGTMYWYKSEWSVVVPYTPNEKQAKHIVHNAQRKLGLTTTKDAAKRSARAIKQRQMREANRARQETARSKDRLSALQKELAEKKRLRDAELGGVAAVLTAREVRAIVKQIERESADLRRWQRLATEVPLHNSAKHRA